MDSLFKGFPTEKEDAELGFKGGGGNGEIADAPFSQIYELIFHNQSLVQSELLVLQHLIKQKLNDFVVAEPDGNNGQAHQAYKRQTVIGRLLKDE